MVRQEITFRLRFRPVLNRLESRTVPASFQGLGFVSFGDVYSEPTGISADGSVVVGKSKSASGLEQAFRWTANDAMIGIGFLNGGNFSSAESVSADGSVIVGCSNSSANGGEAFRWTAAGGMVGLGDLPGGGFGSTAYGVSADGTVVVGGGHSFPDDEAFQWTAETGMKGLGFIAGSSNSYATGVSADGLTIIGNNEDRAFRRSNEFEGMVTIADFTGGGSYSNSRSVSANGSVIVGSQNSSNGSEGYRWTANSGMNGLGFPTLGNYSSAAFGVSADGTTIVGNYSLPVWGDEAFIWTAAGGMRSVSDVLAFDYGLSNELTGWQLRIAFATSADGRTIVGYGTNPSGKTEGWIAKMDAPLGPPRIQSVQVNDGTIQRSQVTRLTVTFNKLVNLPANPANAFQLVSQGTNESVMLHGVQVGNVVILDFTGGPVDGKSLSDGRYTLTVVKSQVNNGDFDSVGSSLPGENYVMIGDAANGIFRLAGDANGDSRVSATDFAVFRTAFGGYSFAFDFDGDGHINANDFSQFRARYGQSV